MRRRPRIHTLLVNAMPRLEQALPADTEGHPFWQADAFENRTNRYGNSRSLISNATGTSRMTAGVS